ncbi:DUF4365 domain-containing protein [Flagellimonas aurea]|uniref:DUF4365 domain-containing protein n=1 Tax=Flagellimonas aurea TaxID=2915619 RepID=UPI0035CF0273
MNHDLKKIHLPKSSDQQNLEILSKKEFERLFDEDRFILKPETTDNGIDYRCELKQDNIVLGFGFNFQLKSVRKSKINDDGSISKTLDTSNIEYLINNGQPAYYGFYVQETGNFFYESLDSFISKLEKKSINWQSQKSHTLRFSKKLDSEAIEAIFSDSFNKGIMLRKVNMHIANSHGSLDSNNKILIGAELEVKSDNEIHETIENFGFALIDQCRWNEILKYHGNTSIGKNESAKYKLIIGIAYYYKGHFYKALDYFREAKINLDELTPSVQNHLVFMESSTKRILDIIKEEEYKKILSELKDEGHLKIQIELNKAVTDLKPLRYTSENLRSSNFEDALERMMENLELGSHQWCQVKSEWLIYKYEVAISNYSQAICKINATESISGFNEQTRKQLAIHFLNEFKALNKEMISVLNELIRINNRFAFHYLLTNKIKLEFYKMVDVQFLRVVQEPKYHFTDLSKEYDQLLDQINDCEHYFKTIGHVENEMYAKSIKYEIQHFLGRLEDAEMTITELEKLCNMLDIADLKERIEFLKSGGTNHQLLSKTLRPIEVHRDETNRLRQELLELDRTEKVSVTNINEYHQINLFPMGVFLVPEKEVNKLFEIFSIEDEELIGQIKTMFNLGVVPIINTYVFPVIKEGPLDGNLENKGLQSYRNMYNARKAFFNYNFYRLDH